MNYTAASGLMFVYSLCFEALSVIRLLLDGLPSFLCLTDSVYVHVCLCVYLCICY